LDVLHTSHIRLSCSQMACRSVRCIMLRMIESLTRDIMILLVQKHCSFSCAISMLVAGTGFVIGAGMVCSCEIDVSAFGAIVVYIVSNCC